MSVFTYIHIHSVLQLILFSFVKILRLRKSCSISIHFRILRNYETRNWPPFAGPYKGVHRGSQNFNFNTKVVGSIPSLDNFKKCFKYSLKSCFRIF